MYICRWVTRLPSAYTYTRMWIRSHKDKDLSTYIYICTCYCPPSGTKTYKFTATNPYTLLFNEFVSYQSLEEDFLEGEFNAQISSHQGQDSHLGIINLLDVPRLQRLRESKDNSHYNTFGQYLT